jgi:hypothetical protein
LGWKGEIFETGAVAVSLRQRPNLYTGNYVQHICTGKAEKQYHRQGKKVYKNLLIKTKNTKYKEATMAALNVNCRKKNRFFYIK